MSLYYHGFGAFILQPSFVAEAQQSGRNVRVIVNTSNCVNV